MTLLLIGFYMLVAFYLLAAWLHFLKKATGLSPPQKVLSLLTAPLPFRSPSSLKKGGKPTDASLFVPWGRIQSLSPCRREVWREVFQIP